MSVNLEIRRRELRFADSYSRMSALLALSNAPDFWSLVNDEWSCCDNIGRYNKRLMRLLERQRARHGFPILAALREDALALYSQLPEVITVWRGCYPENRLGLSWTLNRDSAARFPFFMRYRQRDTSRAILVEGRIRRDDIAFIVTDEAEVVTLPSAITIVSESRAMPTTERAA